MTTIYVVTAGCYSAYHICAVYDSKEAADYHAAHLETQDEGPDDGVRVEKYELNPHRQIIADRLKPFRVEVAWNGDTHAVESCALEEVQMYRACLTLVEAEQSAIDDLYYKGQICDADRHRRYMDVPAAGQFYVLATDAQHAVKIVNERRTHLIAEGRWPENPSREEEGLSAGKVWYDLEPRPAACDG